MKMDYVVPPFRKIRVIIDSDCANEADDQFALAHALLSPKLDVVGILSTHYSDRFGPDSERESYEEIARVVDLLGMSGRIPLFHGAAKAMPDQTVPVFSEGATFIAKEALRDDSRPLFVLSLGAATNAASALLIAPSIAARMTVVWVGGSDYPDGRGEFNLRNDIAAANCLLDSSVRLWQIPINAYREIRIGLATLQDRISSCGSIGRYLCEHLYEVATYERCYAFSLRKYADDPAACTTAYPSGEVWQLGDSAAIGVILCDHLGCYREIAAPRFNDDMSYELRPLNKRKIRLYDRVDSYFILEDMIAKLRIFTNQETSR